MSLICLQQRARPWLWLLALATLLPGCTSVQKALSFVPGIPNPDTTRIRHIEVAALANANQNSATEMDVLFLLDTGLSDSLPLTAREWFDNRARFLMNHRETLLVVPVELPPGGSVRLDLPKGYKKARDVIAYANYFSSKGQKWLRLPNTASVSIQLSPQQWDFSASSN